ncbi:hypothetical protein [Absidia glauca]|uniref:Uncharacterized protein n=1 Tax=Absidia glauca TaxID=4829 RepID=A0A168MU95_ABSGL|nr:hypothetical protein [Absidia glauca]
MVAFLLAPSAEEQRAMPGWQPSAVNWSLWIKKEVIEDDLLDLSSSLPPVATVDPARTLLSSAPRSPPVPWTTTTRILTVCSDPHHHHQQQQPPLPAPGTPFPTPPPPAPGATTPTSAPCRPCGALSSPMAKSAVVAWSCCPPPSSSSITTARRPVSPPWRSGTVV